MGWRCQSTLSEHFVDCTELWPLTSEASGVQAFDLSIQIPLDSEAVIHYHWRYIHLQRQVNQTT